MLLLTFSKTGQEDILLTEDDLFDFNYEANAYSGEAFELGGVCAKSIYLIIDNNTQRFSRGTFANSRIKLEIDGHFYGYFNAELPKRRNGVIELNAYDDMVKLDVEFPTDYLFPQTFWAVYAQCVFEAGLAADISFDNVVLNGVWDNGIISADYTDYIYANSCRNLVSGMAEWNGGFAHINSEGKLQVDKFSKTVSREYRSGELMELDYSDDTVVFSKVKTSQKNKTYEKGDESGYTLVLNNQYISYGLDDDSFENYLTLIYDYYNGFSLTPMSFTIAEPDFQLHIGDRIQVYDEEEQVTITGNVSKIEISGNCSMKVTCGGFENISSSSNFTPTSFSQISQAKTEATQAAGVSGGVAEKLQTSGSDYAIITGENGASILENSVELVKVRVKDFFDLKKSGEYEFYADGGNGFYISVAPSMPQYAMYDNSLSITESGGIVIRANSSVGIDILTNNIEIKIGRNDITPILIKAGTDRIHVTGGELFFNGKKVLTE